jgi:sugar phosphate isomerase/epimerase
MSKYAPGVLWWTIFKSMGSVDLLRGEDALTFNTSVARHSTLVMQLDIARQAGYGSVEVTAAKIREYLSSGFGPADLSEQLHGLDVKGIGALINVERQGGDTSALLSEAEELYALANQIGAKGITVVTGPLDVQAVQQFQSRATFDGYKGLLGRDETDQLKLTSSNLRRLADSAAAHGLLLYVEALSWAPLGKIDQQLRLLDRTERDNVKIVLDFWHCYTSGASPDDIAKIDPHQIYGVHVCDSLPFSGGVPVEVVLRDVPTGSGVLNLQEWTDAVKATGYSDWWCSETFSKKQHQQNSYEVAKMLRAQLKSLVLGY